MRQPLHFTSRDVAGQRVWAVTLDHAEIGYTVSATIGSSRWRGTIQPTGTGRGFILIDETGMQVSPEQTYRTLALAAEAAAHLARRRERAKSRPLVASPQGPRQSWCPSCRAGTCGLHGA